MMLTRCTKSRQYSAINCMSIRHVHTNSLLFSLFLKHDILFFSFLPYVSLILRLQRRLTINPSRTWDLYLLRPRPHPMPLGQRPVDYLRWYLSSIIFSITFFLFLYKLWRINTQSRLLLKQDRVRLNTGQTGQELGPQTSQVEICRARARLNEPKPWARVWIEPSP